MVTMNDNTFVLTDKVILVTGASSGIGQATAILLSKLGARVILTGRDSDRLQKTFEQLSNKDLHVMEIFDFEDTENIVPFCRNAVEKIGKPLNGFVHCAGAHKIAPLRMMSVEHVHSLMNTNLYSGLHLLRGCTENKVADDGASFVFISSVAAIVGEAGVITYAASKGAISSAVKAASIELAHRKIRVNCVLPGLVETAMTSTLKKKIGEKQYSSIIGQHPLGAGRPNDIASAVAFLLSDGARWVTGTSLVVDGGYSTKQLTT